MKRVLLVYSAPDIKTLGQGTDEEEMTDEFQAMLVEASKLSISGRAVGMDNIS